MLMGAEFAGCSGENITAGASCDELLARDWLRLPRTIDFFLTR